MKKNTKRGFTLIELLAVIVILAVLLAIAVPMVSGFIFNSKRSAYIDNLKLYIDDIRNRVNVGEYAFTDPNVTYYVHFNNLDVEKAKKSPFANWQDGYVVVVFDEMTYDYYVTSVDQKGYKVIITEENQLVKDSVFKDSDLTLSVGRGIGNRDKVIVYDADGVSNEEDAFFEYTEEEAEQCFNYKIENEQITILRYKDTCSKDVVIPTKIENYPVKVIGANSFQNLSITSVRIPEGVSLIQKDAFKSNLITSLTLPSTVTTIADGAFANNRLPELPDISMVTSLGSAVFSGNLFDEDQAFIYAKNNDGSFNYSIIAGYAGSSKNLVLPAVKNGVSLKEIGNQAFRGIKIDTIVIPNGVEVIGKQAFEYCGLQSISLPSTLKTINEYAFSGNKLTSLSIPTSVTFIGRRAFNQNSLPDSEAYIYKRTVSGIDYSTIVSYGGASRSITIPAIKNGVTLKTIANASFYESNLTKVVIPDTVTSIEMLAFNNNKLPDSDAFIYKRTASGIDYSTIVSYAGANKQVNIPASKNGVALRTIDRYAFYQTYITSVTLPEGLKTINNSAFEVCYLNELTIPSTVTSIGANAFKKVFSWGNFNSFDQIINKSSTAFNWTSITGGIGNNTFVTGTITHPYGDIEVKSS